MPSRQSLDAFIAQVVAGDHVGAIRDWYHDDAWMQENQAAPRQGGREALMQQEAAVMARAESVETELLGGPLIECDRVAIRWRFSFVFKAGGKMQMEEIAWQTWRGDRSPRRPSSTRPGAAEGLVPFSPPPSLHLLTQVRRCRYGGGAKATLSATRRRAPGWWQPCAIVARRATDARRSLRHFPHHGKNINLIPAPPRPGQGRCALCGDRPRDRCGCGG
jgi:hypothetical protein